MPFVVITGYPCSGKSRTAHQLKTHFSEKYPDKKVILISSDDQLDRNSVFAESRLEKELRSRLIADVQRNLGRDNVVILDAANYIKGYRYELYCLSKSLKSTQCTISLPVNIETAWQLNYQRPEDERYSREIFDALILRYEEPDSKNRWDSPLIVVHENEQMPFDTIDAALFERKAARPNQATQSQPLLSTNFLYDLDRLTQETVEKVLKNPNEFVDRRITLAQLSRLRRQFIVYVKQNPIEDTKKIGPLFEDYIRNTAL